MNTAHFHPTGQRPSLATVLAQLAPAAVCLALLGAGGAQAQTKTTYSAVKTSKTPTKTFKVLTPEEAAGCPIPTLEECQAEGYFTHDPCGELQADHEDWTCWTLIMAASESLPKGRSMFTRELVASGVAASVAKAEQTDDELETTVVADALNLGSRGWTASFPGQSSFTSGQVAWGDGDEHFDSCQEYAFEQHSELNAFWREVGADRHDYRRTYEIAFSDGGEPWAIGAARRTKSMRGKPYRDINGQSTSIPSVRADIYRNHFFDLELPTIGGSFVQSPVQRPSGPNLLASLIGYSDIGAAIRDKIEDNRELVTKSLDDYRIAFEHMTVEGRETVALEPTYQATPGTTGFTGADSLISETAADIVGPAIDDASPVTGLIDPAYTDGKLMRRMFVDEFNELYDLQLERNRLVARWDELNRIYGDSWRVADLLDELDDDDPFGTFRANGDSTVGGGYVDLNQWQAPSDDDGDDDGSHPIGSPIFTDDATNPGPGDGASPLSEENAARKAVLDAMLVLYEIADVYGCLDAGLTYCDVSLKEFALEAVTHADVQTQAAYERCAEHLPAPFSDHHAEQRWFFAGNIDTQGLDMEVINDNEDLRDAYDAVREEACGHVIYLPMTPTTYDALVAKTMECKARLPAYQAQLGDFMQAYNEHAERYYAMERIAAIPALIDPATGEVKTPGIGTDYTNNVGGKYFGFELHYAYALNGDLPDDDACHFSFEAGGEFSSKAKIITHVQPLIEGHAWVRSADRTVDVGASAFGHPLYDGGDWAGDTVGDGFEAELSFVRQSRSVDMAGYTQRFMIGPVPLSISAGAAGTMGYDTEIDASFEALTADEGCPQAAMTATLRPSLGVSGFVELAIDAVIAKAGVRGEITIFELAIPVDLDAATTTTIDAQDGPQVDLAVGVGARAEFVTLAGLISAFVEVGIGGLSKRFSKTLVRWDGFRWDKQLFSQDYAVSVNDLILARDL